MKDLAGPDLKILEFRVLALLSGPPAARVNLTDEKPGSFITNYLVCMVN